MEITGSPKRTPKRILFIGLTGTGKSTIINSLYNQASDSLSLKHPAPAENTTTGVTAKVTTYWNLQQGRCYVDSVGIGDPRFSLEQQRIQLKETLFCCKEGIHQIFLCIRFGRFSVGDRMAKQVIEQLFDVTETKWFTLVITHCDGDDDMTKEKYLKQHVQHDREMRNLFDKFQEKIIFGSNLCPTHPRKEELQFETRTVFRQNIEKIIQESPNNSLKLPPITTLFQILIELLKYICYREIACLFDATAVVVEYSKQLLLDYEHFYGICAICNEKIFKHYVITTCDHVYHRQCIFKEWCKNNTCPLCGSQCDIVC